MSRQLQWVKANLTSMGLAAYVPPMPTPKKTTHWPDCAMNHGGPTCDMGPDCGGKLIPKHLVIRRHNPILSKRELALLTDIEAGVAIVSDPLRTVRGMVDRGLVVEREPGLFKLTPAGEEVRLAWKRAGW